MSKCVSAKRKPSKTVEPHHKVQAEILTGEEGGKEKRDMTEGLITSLFKQGTTPKQTELQSQEREGE